MSHVMDGVEVSHVSPHLPMGSGSIESTHGHLAHAMDTTPSVRPTEIANAISVMTQKFTLAPKVNPTREFLEITTDFAHPLDIVREAISNAFDSGGTAIWFLCSTQRELGEHQTVIEIRDNGQGMDHDQLSAFFDLGNSSRANDPTKIGEKGHGTKIYFNSSRVEVTTVSAGRTFVAVMDEPLKALHRGNVPDVSVTENLTPTAEPGTCIRIYGYNGNRRDRFTQDLLRDYIQWFTKFGSVEAHFGITRNLSSRLYLKGLDVLDAEEISFGHYFPPEHYDIDRLFHSHSVEAPAHYCRKFKFEGQLKRFPEISYQFLAYVEGHKVKLSYNRLLKRQGWSRGVYTVQERYGFWVGKDFIPVQNVNEWVGHLGTGYQKFHGFINCSALGLTANRGSVNNTPIEILDELKAEVQAHVNGIVNGDEWRALERLESNARGHASSERERRDFADRKQRFNRSEIAMFQALELVEPQCEAGVFGLLIQLMAIKPDAFPFTILDYNTHEGYDLLVKGDPTTAISQSEVFYVELKWQLLRDLNHSFQNLTALVCWDTRIKNGASVVDLNNEERQLRIVAPQQPDEHTAFFLDHPRSGRKIEVFVLKHYLREKFGIEFCSRNACQTV
jgi:hypothetical protein